MRETHAEDRPANLMGRTAASVGAFAEDVMTQAEGLASRAADEAEHAYGQARDQVRSAAASVAGSFEKQPFIALVAVGIVCAAVGFVLARR
jgi:uncharacterized protein YjbJ (UPF0337 family)